MPETLFELEALAEKAKGRVELQRATEKLMRWAAEEGWPLSKLTNPKGDEPLLAHTQEARSAVLPVVS